jgi:hypothetical protein
MSDGHDGARYRTSTTQRSLPVHMRSRWLYNETHLLILAERGVKTDRLTPPPAVCGVPLQHPVCLFNPVGEGPPHLPRYCPPLAARFVTHVEAAAQPAATRLNRQPPSLILPAWRLLSNLNTVASTYQP